MHITRSWHTRGGPARLTGNEPVSMSVKTVRECIRRLDRFGHVWASFLCVSCAVHLLSCRLVNPENPSAFEVMDPCCGAGVYLALFSANGYGLTVVLLMRRCLSQCCAGKHKHHECFCFRGADYQVRSRGCGTPGFESRGCGTPGSESP